MGQKAKKNAGRSGIDAEGIKYVTGLLSLTTRMLSAFNLDKLLKQILDMSLEYLKADTGSLMMIDEKGPYLKIKAARGLDKKIVDSAVIKVGEKVSGWVAQKGEPLLLIGGLRSHPKFRHLDEKKEIKSSISVPLKVEDRVLGVLNVNNVSSEAVFSEDDLKILSLLGNQAAISIWSLRLYEEAKKASEELRSAQQQLIAREKMAALGQLSTGIAHEVNNPLTAVLANTQYLIDGTSREDRGWEELQEIKDATELASRIIQRLFNYCKPSSFKRAPVDLNDVIDKVVKLIRYQLEKQRIKVTVSLNPAPAVVEINPDEAKEVFLNIILNSKSAMPDGGSLDIAVKGPGEKGFIEVVVKDAGCGIPADVIGRIFDPFFTTRRPGSVGLGLSICQRIARNNGGVITAQSERGKGAAFTVRLPAKKQAGKG